MSIEMKVIGVGLGRTGTLSLKVALEEIGFSPCYHMLDFSNFLGNLRIWLKLGGDKQINWEELFQGYAAGVDFPFTTFYKDIFDEFPELRVILTVRDPQEWYESAEQTIYNIQYVLINGLPGGIKIGKKTIWYKLFKGNFKNRDFAINVFLNHINEVKNFIPEDRLLVFNVKDGWDPLCQFLDVPVPNKKFPHVNRRSTMWWAIVFLLLLLVFILFGFAYLLIGLF